MAKKSDTTPAEKPAEQPALEIPAETPAVPATAENIPAEKPAEQAKGKRGRPKGQKNTPKANKPAVAAPAANGGLRRIYQENGQWVVYEKIASFVRREDAEKFAK